MVDIQRESGIRAGERLFETLLVFENYPVDAANLRQPAGLALGPVTFLERTNYPLAIAAIPGSTLLLRLFYDRARFSEEVSARILADMAALLRAVVLATGQEPLRRTIEVALSRVSLDDTLPEGVRKRLGLCEFREAIQLLHRPLHGDRAEVLSAREGPAWRRVKFDELLAQIGRAHV